MVLYKSLHYPTSISVRKWVLPTCECVERSEWLAALPAVAEGPAVLRGAGRFGRFVAIVARSART